jgi:hypothetical protein
MHFPQEFVLQREILAVQLFGDGQGHAHMEQIPGEAHLVADCPSQYARMIEILWQDRRYIAFERDLEERAVAAKKSEHIQIAQ